MGIGFARINLVFIINAQIVLVKSNKDYGKKKKKWEKKKETKNYSEPTSQVKQKLKNELKKKNQKIKWIIKLQNIKQFMIDLIKLQKDQK